MGPGLLKQLLFGLLIGNHGISGKINTPVRISELFRRGGFVALKLTIKEWKAFKPARVHNLCDGHIGLNEHFTGDIYSVLIQERKKWLIHKLTEKP